MPSRRSTLPVRFPNGAVINCEVDEQGYVELAQGSFNVRQLLVASGVPESVAKDTVDRLYGRVYQQ